MLVRFTVSNFLSFKEPTEFNMLTGNPRRLEHHVYEPVKGLALLKMAAVYGANGAGKSNLVKAMYFLYRFVAKGWLSPATFQFKLKIKSSTQPTTFEVEFICGGAPYLYGIELSSSHILEEWLYRAQPGKEDDLIFHRYTKQGETLIEAAPEFTQTEEQRLRLRLYEKEILKPTESLLRLLGESKADFGPVQDVFSWISRSLVIWFPQSMPKEIIRDLVLDPRFFDFAKDLLCSFHTGIEALEIETHNLDQFFGADDSEKISHYKTELAAAEADGRYLVVEHSWPGDQLLIITEQGKPVVKRLVARHEGAESGTAPFQIWQESDGTQRLFELVPVFYYAVNSEGVMIIDEIERAIHPALLKSLVTKFAQDEHTRGQLIFTTHEAHLLDQEFMRQDEFWFAEKSNEGATSLTPLSDFKDVRYDLDLRKGYLLGRFGAIPFTGDLRHFNWDAYAEAELQ